MVTYQNNFTNYSTHSSWLALLPLSLQSWKRIRFNMNHLTPPPFVGLINLEHSLRMSTIKERT